MKAYRNILSAAAIGLFGCTIIARDTGWELIRCENGGEICFLHHTIMPTSDSWAISCFWEPAGNRITIPPGPNELKFHGR